MSLLSFNTMPECALCGRQVDGEWLTVQSRMFHVGCVGMALRVLSEPHNYPEVLGHLAKWGSWTPFVSVLSDVEFQKAQADPALAALVDEIYHQKTKAQS